MWSRIYSIMSIVALTLVPATVSFAPQAGWTFMRRSSITMSPLHQTTTSTPTSAGSFIETQLRGAAMKLHTTVQSPKEGTVVDEQPKVPYVPTHADYLQFLVDSQHVYQALEEIVNDRPELEPFRATKLERVAPLELDIQYMSSTYGLDRPTVSPAGTFYATHLRSITSVPEFMCHFYNFYFAHTAGGRMIGKQMSSLLLEKKTLEFYKWDGDLNEIKQNIKAKIEAMAAAWTEEEKQECVDGTAMAFRGGGGINASLSGGGKKGV